MLDLDTRRVIPQELDAEFGLTIGCPEEGDEWDEDGLNFEWLIDEGTPIMGVHRVEYDGVEYDVTVEIRRVEAPVAEEPTVVLCRHCRTPKDKWDEYPCVIGAVIDGVASSVFNGTNHEEEPSSG